MRNQTLSNSAKNYFEYKDKSKYLRVSKEGKMRFDLAEGLWLKDKDGQLPDRNHSKVKTSLVNFLGVKEENISVFAGADEIIEIIPRLFLNKSDKTVVVVPVFERMISANMKVGAKVLHFKLVKDNKFRLDNVEADKLVKKVNKYSAKLLWLCSPNNPTGQVIELSIVEKIARSLPGSLVVVNEVYQEYYSFDRKNSAVSLLSKFPNLIIIRSFSKAYNLAGVRIGYVVAGSEIVSYLDRFKTMYNPSTYAQGKAVWVLSSDKTKEIKKLLDRISKERTRLTKLVKKLTNFEVIDDSKANFLFLRHKTKDLFKEFYKHNIIVSDWREALGVEGKGFVRVSINTPKFNNRLARALEVIN